MGLHLVALDIETTGLDPERDSITEIGAIKFQLKDGAQVVDTFSTLVNPLRPIPFKIQKLTGISNEEVQDAPRLTAVIPRLAGFVGDATVVGHNVGFEASFLRRHGVLVQNPLVDTFELARILLPRLATYNLFALTDQLGIPLVDHHRALPDATAAKDVFVALMEQGRALDLAVLQEINRTAARSDWPLKQVFLDLERARVKTAFTSSIREQLRAKGYLDDAALGLVLDRKEQAEPLAPTEELVPVDEEKLVEILSPGGLLSEHLKGYEHRPQQVELLRRVVQAFNDGGQLLAEAGTGIGKSLAYLLPAIHFAVQNGRPVVVSTNTINLQDQLYHKDLPDLQAILPDKFRATVLKGRNNYLCLRRLALLRRSESLSPEAVQVLAKVLVWLPVTETGDSAELSLRETEQGVWREIQAEQETCLGDRCPHMRKGRCFLYRARREAEAAHIIVVNHALLLSDVMVSNRVLPEYKHLIIDEAHHLEARATEQLGFAVNHGQAVGLLTALSQTGPAGQARGFLHSIPQHFRGSKVSADVQKQVGDYVNKLTPSVEQAQHTMDAFFSGLREFVDQSLVTEAGGSPGAAGGRGSGENYDRHVELTRGVRNQPGWTEIEVAAEELSNDLSKVEQGLRGLHSGFSNLDDQNVLEYDDLMQDLWARLEHLRQAREQLTAIVSEPAPSGIYWMSIAARDGQITLHSAPLHVGPLLEKNIYQKLQTVVLTSATLRTAMEFNYIRERLGLEDADEFAVDSPFDYENSTLLYLATDIPEPAQPNYQKSVASTIIELCLATSGRTLVLFTSHSQLQATYYAVTRPLEEANIVVFGQGLDGSRRQLLENFKSTPRSVLMGTRSFWEGIDVVGPALSCLVIPRLPFSVPSDPVFAARSRTFDDPFGQYAVPEAVLRFRQGFGRLIRSYSDRGVVVVLDKRVLSKNYGGSFLDSLPGCTVYRGRVGEIPAKAAAWIDSR
ncbi:MAG: putative ATP-dependent helicase DinG [Chloroflexi bacterium ADurb.Bin180]|nr:MAG: putative ATP-dependent helicase DinG [Chloroflexi bacterium ADurb.Bin180]